MYLRLRFTDEAQGRAALAGFVAPDGGWAYPDRLVILGTLYDATALGLDGAVSIGAPLPGWHADLVTEDAALIDALTPYIVAPAAPRHVIVGQA